MTVPAVQITRLGKSFGGYQALKTVSLSVERGECVVLCGPYGSGKSTLIRCINRLEDFSEGSVAIGGEDLPRSGPDLAHMRQRIGMVFPDSNLVPHFTVVENCAFALRRGAGLPADEAEAIARVMLDRVHLAPHAGKRPGQLTAAQQQRVAIARALAMNPEVVLFDDPTSALDRAMAGEVLALMADLAQDGLTMICATHEMGFARRAADRIVFMDQGRVIEVAPPDRFLDTPSSARARAFVESLA